MKQQAACGMSRDFYSLEAITVTGVNHCQKLEILACLRPIQCKHKAERKKREEGATGTAVMIEALIGIKGRSKKHVSPQVHHLMVDLSQMLFFHGPKHQGDA